MAKPVVAVIAPGNMGAGVGARLAENGVNVLTSLEGRSEASRTRAAKAGMTGATDPEIAAADIVLSIVPPGEALPLAERLAPALRAANAKPVYVDCNAVSPQTAGRVAAVIEQTGSPFVDGGIIGGPPRAGYDGPVIYVSGAELRARRDAQRFRSGDHADRRPGSAPPRRSRCPIGGITKGLIGDRLRDGAGRAAAPAWPTRCMPNSPRASPPCSPISTRMRARHVRARPIAGSPRWKRSRAFTGSEAEREMYEGDRGALFERLAADNGRRTRPTSRALRGIFRRPPTKPVTESRARHRADLLFAAFRGSVSRLLLPGQARRLLYRHRRRTSGLRQCLVRLLSERLARDRGRAQSLAVATRKRRAAARPQYPGAGRRGRGRRGVPSRQRLSRPLDHDRGSCAPGRERIRQGIADDARCR